MQRVGASKVLLNSAPFANAREPLAQAFKAVGDPDSAAFGVITNHFKSKSASGASGDNLDTGQGGYNGDRTRQATALADFADQFKLDRGIQKIFLAGDFNSYTQEDPMQVLYGRGYTKLESDQTGETSYSFSGLSGSLDHVLVNAAALPAVKGVDIWEINAPESVGLQYSRFNYNVTELFEGNNPFASSDHNPEIVGIDTGLRQIQILGINDFHGRIANNTAGDEAGAAVLAGAVKQMRAQNPDTVFAAAGDLIGASTFESFIQQDKPTIDALNEAGLEVSAVGNHEFDQGYDDLVNRVMAPYDADHQPLRRRQLGVPRRQRQVQGRRLRRSRGDLDPDFGDVTVGFVGAVTEHLPELGEPGRDRRHRGHRHRAGDQRGGQRAQGGRRRHRGAARPRGRGHHGVRLRGRPGLGLRQDRQRRQQRTSTRSSPGTRTWRTTTPSRCRPGPPRAVRSPSVRSSRPVSTA